MNYTSNFILQKASAGSGKTFALVKRFLLLVLDSENPEYFKQLLAITFTNKASLEMKERIINNLIVFSGRNAENDKMFSLVLDELAIDSIVLKNRAKNILIKIIHQYSQFSVCTIDKFNLRLMRSFSFDLGLSTNFSVELDNTKLLLESINLLFEDIGTEKNLTDSLIDYTFQNMEEDRKWDLTKSILETTKNISSEQFGNINQILKNISFNEYLEYKKEILARLKFVKKELVEYSLEAQNLIEEYSLEPKDFYKGEASGIAGYFKKIKNKKYDKLNSYHIDFINSNNLYSKATKENIKQAIEAIQPKLSELALNCSQLIKELNYKSIINNSLLTQSLFNQVIQKLNIIKENNNILPINEFNSIISEHIKNQSAIFIYEKLGEYYKHFFIDEFQDTSTLQWQNLTPLIENSIASDGSVFLVGDVKQSIYRFRGANPKLMIDLIENSDAYRLKVETLETNYRSFSSIIEFNNHFYNFLTSEITNPSYQLVYEDVKQLITDKLGGYVQLNYLEDPEENLINEKILESILKCVEVNYNFSDIAILVPNHSNALAIAEFLSKKSIPIVSNKSLFIDSSEEIKCIIYCLKNFINNQDQESLTKFCISLKKINKIPSTIDFTLFLKKIISFKRMEEIIFFLSDQINIDLSFSFEEENDLYTKIEKLIFKLNFNDSKNTYIQTFLDIVLKFSIEKGSNLLKFIEFWDRESKNIEIAIPKELDGVRILTIHASKGLEFPVVILPNFNFSIKFDNLWISTENKEVPIVFAKKTALSLLENTEIETKIADEQDFLQLELFNKIYVATTRGVEKLFILSEKPKRSPANSKDYFKLYLEKNYPNQIEIKIGDFKNHQSSLKKVSKTEIIPSSFYDWSSKISIAQKYIKIYKNEENKNYGNLIHLFLGEIFTQKDIQIVIEKNVYEGVIQMHEKDKLDKLLNKIVDNPTLKQYFNTENKIIYNERTFINKAGEFLRPDKVILTENSCVILDYKTGNKEESHVIQLNKYQEMFNKEYKQITKLLVYLKGNEIQIIEV